MSLPQSTKDCFGAGRNRVLIVEDPRWIGLLQNLFDGQATERHENFTSFGRGRTRSARDVVGERFFVGPLKGRRKSLHEVSLGFRSTAS
jgi:hypothetical protein